LTLSRDAGGIQVSSTLIASNSRVTPCVHKRCSVSRTCSSI